MVNAFARRLDTKEVRGEACREIDRMREYVVKSFECHDHGQCLCFLCCLGKKGKKIARDNEQSQIKQRVRDLVYNEVVHNEVLRNAIDDSATPEWSHESGVSHGDDVNEVSLYSSALPSYAVLTH